MITTILGYSKPTIVFTTLSGDIEVTVAEGWYTLDFPSRMPEAAVLPELIAQGLMVPLNWLRTLMALIVMMVFLYELLSPTQLRRQR